jgi:hypothetical protein
MIVCSRMRAHGRGERFTQIFSREIMKIIFFVIYLLTLLFRWKYGSEKLMGKNL